MHMIRGSVYRVTSLGDTVFVALKDYFPPIEKVVEYALAALNEGCKQGDARDSTFITSITRVEGMERNRTIVED